MTDIVMHDVIILGSGPAGLTAALYCARAGKKTLVLGGDRLGGQTAGIAILENYPGWKGSGLELAEFMKTQAETFGAEIIFTSAKNISGDAESAFSILADDGNRYVGKTVIIATGASPRKLEIEGAKEFFGKGVSYCAVCDGSFFKGEPVTVIGGGTSALEESLYLTQFASRVYIVIRRDVFRAEPIIQKQIEENPKIHLIKKHIPKEILAEEGRVSAIVLEEVETHQTMTLETKAVFPYIGAVPCTQFVKTLPILDASGYVIVNEQMETAVPGIFGAGDVTVKPLRQVVTAANDGAIAAQRAFHWIKG